MMKITRGLFPGCILSIALLTGCAEPDDGISGTGRYLNDDLEGYLKQGMLNRGSTQVDTESDGADGSPVAAPDESPAGKDQSGNPPAHSTSNNQEEGVQQPDRVKTDGYYIAHLNESLWFTSQADTLPADEIVEPYFHSLQQLNIFDAGKPDDQEPVYSLAIDGRQNVDFVRTGLLIHRASKKLVQLGSTELVISDMSSPEQGLPALADIQLSTQVRDARLIDNQLVLVSYYYPQLEGFVNYPSTTAQVQANVDLLEETSLQTLLPKITINGDEQLLASDADCQITVAEEGYHVGGLYVVTVLDVNDPSQFASYCQADNFSFAYVSSDNMYLVKENDYSSVDVPETDCANCTSLPPTPDPLSTVFRVNLDGEPALKGKVSVDGRLNHDTYRLSEYDDHLRVTSSRGTVHRLDTFALTESGMQHLASLPNGDRPDPIGKPNENIEGIRYDGDRAYIVTFRRIDPLYVIDLSNPADPMIAGELEIPGYSAYLHPLNNDWLLGFGYADVSSQYIKISLYDVRDISAPKETGTIAFDTDWSYSPVVYDPLALSTLADKDGQPRFALPVGESQGAGVYSEFLYLFSVAPIDDVTMDAALIEQDRLQTSGDDYLMNARGVFVEDDVHMLYGNKRYSYSWPR